MVAKKYRPSAILYKRSAINSNIISVLKLCVGVR